MATAEQTLRLFVKGLSERKGIDLSFWAKKFIKNIDYSKEEIAVILYHKRSSDGEERAIFGSGRPHPAAAKNVRSGLDKKISPTGTCRGNCQDWLPGSNSIQTIDIILPNTIHGCKRKNL